MSAKERREREKEQRKRQILDVARALLLEKGLNDTSINQIAKRAELSIGAIYFYYKNKEEIYAALQVEGLGLLTQAIKKAVKKTAAPEDKIRNLALAYLKFSEKQKNYFSVITYFLSSPEPIFSEKFKREIDERSNDSLKVLCNVISEGIEKRIFKNTDSREKAVILWSALHGMIQLKKLQKTILSVYDHKILYLGAVEHFLEGLRLPATKKPAKES